MIDLKTIRDVAIVGFSLAIVFLVVEILIGNPFEAIETPIHDALEKGSLSENKEIVLVDLDEESVMALGDSVYWSYLWLPEVIDKLGESKAIAITLPVSPFVDFAPSSLQRLYSDRVDSLSKWFRLSPERLAEIIDSLIANNDPGASLVETVRSVGRVYLGFNTITNRHTDRIVPFDVQVKQSVDSLKTNTAIVVAEDYYAPPDSLIFASEGVGFLDVAYSEDGFVRSIPLVVLCKNKVYTSLAFTVLRALEGFEDVDLPNSKLLKLGVEDFLLGDGYYYRIHYTSGLDDYTRIPVSALRSGSIPPDTFADKIVLIGSSVEPYSLNVPTPVDGNMPRMVVQANLLSNLMERKQASPPNIVVTFILTLILSLLGAFAVMSPWRKFTFPGMLVILALFYVVVASSTASGVRIAFFTPIVSSALAMISGYLIYFFTEGRKRTYIQQMVRHYFPIQQEKHYTERLLDLPYIKLNRESVVMAVNLSFEKKEKSLQEALKSFDEFRARLLEINRVHGGMRMSFLGNSSMFLFSGPDCYVQALKASLEIRRYYTNFNARYETEGIGEFILGIGMSSGETFVATLGKIPLVDLAVFGDPVLLAGELAILNFELKTKILIEENLHSNIPEGAKVKELGELEIAGDNHVVYEYLR